MVSITRLMHSMEGISLATCYIQYIQQAGERGKGWVRRLKHCKDRRKMKKEKKKQIQKNLDTSAEHDI
jgi:hypothetical protein